MYYSSVIDYIERALLNEEFQHNENGFYEIYFPIIPLATPTIKTDSMEFVLFTIESVFRSLIVVPQSKPNTTKRRLKQLLRNFDKRSDTKKKPSP